MVVTASLAQGTLRPAAVNFTHLKQVQAWRVNNECWVSPNVFLGWAWPYRFVGNDASIDAEGRNVRVTGRTIDGKFLLPLHEIVSQLGGVSSWQGDRDILDVFGQIRSVQVRKGKIVVDSTLGFMPVAQIAERPNRLVLDFKGAKLADGFRSDMDGSARVGQYSPSSVRLVVLTNDRPNLSEMTATRSLEVNYAAPEPNNTGNTTEQQQPQNNQVPFETTGVTVWTNAGPMATIAESERVAQFSLALQQPLLGAPQFKRLGPSSFQLTLPRARYVAPSAPLNSPSITAVEPVEDENGLTLTFRLSRPMGIEFSPRKDQILLTFTKPNVGDGKLAGKLVVVDAGHGGHDSGARSPDGKVNEKSLTLAISKLVAKELAEEGASVIMTRSEDVYIGLKERPEIANRNAADFFVSIHINSNKVDNSLAGSIMFYHGGSMNGELLAQCMESQTKSLPGIRSIGVWSDRRIYDSGFAVLRGSKVPAVLLELGFINHSSDRKQLTSLEYQILAAKAVVRGLKVYLGNANP